ncbi:MAG: hypothetical protein ACE5GL_07825, partial [Calditrichia bacterium]
PVFQGRAIILKGNYEMIKFIDKTPLLLLVVIALLLGFAPFGSESHLLQKIRMLFDGSLTRPIDIFDLFVHGTPALLLLIKIGRIVQLRTTKV